MRASPGVHTAPRAGRDVLSDSQVTRARMQSVMPATCVFCVLQYRLPSSPIPPSDMPCCQASSETGPAVNITVTPDSNTAVMRNTSDNVTYTCTISSGSALWQIAGCGSEGQGDRYSYQMVDQDLFLADGVIILNTESGKTSVLKIRPAGQTFLSQQLKSDNITVQCLAVLDDINVYGGEIYRIEIFGKSILASLCPCGSCIHAWLVCVCSTRHDSHQY